MKGESGGRSRLVRRVAGVLVSLEMTWMPECLALASRNAFSRASEVGSRATPRTRITLPPPGPRIWAQVFAESADLGVVGAHTADADFRVGRFRIQGEDRDARLPGGLKGRHDFLAVYGRRTMPPIAFPVHEGGHEYGLGLGAAVVGRAFPDGPAAFVFPRGVDDCPQHGAQKGGLMVLGMMAMRMAGGPAGLAAISRAALMAESLLANSGTRGSGPSFLQPVARRPAPPSTSMTSERRRMIPSPSCCAMTGGIGTQQQRNIRHRTHRVPKNRTARAPRGGGGSAAFGLRKSVRRFQNPFPDELDHALAVGAGGHEIGLGLDGVNGVGDGDAKARRTQEVHVVLVVADGNDLVRRKTQPRRPRNPSPSRRLAARS